MSTAKRQRIRVWLKAYDHQLIDNSAQKIVDMAKYAKKVAITRTEAQVYNKYLSYEDANGAYSPSNIKRLLENTLSEIEITLEVIKEAK